MDTWTFVTMFTPPAELLKRTSIDLALDGIDTFATIYLNNQLIGSLENFHRWAGCFEEFSEQVERGRQGSSQETQECV